MCITMCPVPIKTIASSQDTTTRPQRSGPTAHWHCGESVMCTSVLLLHVVDPAGGEEGGAISSRSFTVERGSRVFGPLKRLIGHPICP